MKIEEVTEYMRKNIEKNCAVESTARKFGYSKFEFSKKVVIYKFCVAKC